MPMLKIALTFGFIREMLAYCLFAVKLNYKFGRNIVGTVILQTVSFNLLYVV